VNQRLGGLKVKYKFIVDLEELLQEKDPNWLSELESAGQMSPNLIGPAIAMKFEECPIGTSNYRSGATIEWLKGHYENQ
jgi:hypothetical protein